MSAGSGEGADARASGQSASQPDCRVEEAGEHLITLGLGQGLGHMLTVVEQDDDLIGQAPIAEVGDLAAVRRDSGELGQRRRDGLTTGDLRSRRPIETVFGLRLPADLVESALVQADDAHAQTSDLGLQFSAQVGHDPILRLIRPAQADGGARPAAATASARKSRTRCVVGPRSCVFGTRTQ
jgi:hypothetical protein